MEVRKLDILSREEPFKADPKAQVSVSRTRLPDAFDWQSQSTDRFERPTKGDPRGGGPALNL